MLRAKHLGTLSQSARSFFISGSRCSAGDGSSSCTCSDDETCVSKRALRASIRPTPLSKSPVPVSPLLASAASVKKEADAQKTPTNGASPLANSVNSSSPPMADHFVKAGMAAVGLLSDLVNYRIPMTEGSSMLTSSANTVVECAGPAFLKKDNEACVKAKPSSEPTSKPNGTNASSVATGNRGPSRDKIKPASRESRANSNQSESKFSGSSSNPVVESTYRILHRCKWGPTTEAALGRLDCSLDAYQANQVLKQLHDHSVALGFFHWLKRKPGFRHDGHTYTTMVGILGRARQFGAIDSLLDQMAADGCRPNVVTYNRLIHSLGRANYLTEAMGVFDQMRRGACEPDRVTYCTLIDIHAKSGYLDIAIDLYRRMHEVGLSPDTFTYSVIINCLGKAGHLAAAHELFCEMVDRGCVPSLVTYNIMIALHAKARNYRTSLRMYRDMQGAGFEPDKVTYSIVMEVLGHCGHLDEVEAVFDQMKRKKWVPDEPVYGLLVDLWGKAGNVEKAREWYRAMLGAGLCPNVPTCNSLLSAFVRDHRLGDAYGLLRSMIGLGLSPTLQTYTLLLSCCTEARTSFDMTFCCQLMNATGHPAHAFLLSMPAAGPDGQSVRAHVSDFLDTMHSEDRESKRGLVDAVVDFFHKTGLREEAGSIWEAAVKKNVYPDAVRRKGEWYWLVNLHVMSEGTAVTALSRTLAWFRKELLSSGVGPGRVDIVTGWGRRSRVTGSSLVRRAVQELLDVFGFPFFTENGNSGCFVGCGEALDRWLLQSCVERMHLL